jgi:hypothetical protein
MKRVVAMGDFHCGHVVGLTPPQWQHNDYGDMPERMANELRIQRTMWSWYSKALQTLGNVDICVVNGDLIDGKGGRGGGAELLAPNLMDQCDMAVECIKKVRCKQTVVVAGTPYHVNGDDGTDYEEIIAQRVDGKFLEHGWIDVNGLVFDVKHKIGSSSVPHGRNTSLAKEKLWNQLWHDRGGAVDADVLLRSHVHYHTYTGDINYMAMTLPALQGPGSRYGVRQCSGTIDVGFIVFDIESKEDWSWRPYLMNVKELIDPKAVKL